MTSAANYLHSSLHPTSSETLRKAKQELFGQPVNRKEEGYPVTCEMLSTAAISASFPLLIHSHQVIDTSQAKVSKANLWPGDDEPGGLGMLVQSSASAWPQSANAHLGHRL